MAAAGVIAGNPIAPPVDLVPRRAGRVAAFSGLPAGKRRGLGRGRARRGRSVRVPRRGRLNCSLESAAQASVGWETPAVGVDVIGIGSRKVAVLDFCIDSAFSSCELNFWTIGKKDSQRIQLLRRSLGDEDKVLKDVEAPYWMHLSSRAVVLVATAGYGSDHLTASELLSNVDGGAGLGVVIIVKPFSFEGRRRQQEVEYLFKTTKECAKFCIVVDTDALLKTEAVTLSEALKSANSAVLLAINLIYVLTSDKHPRLLYSPDSETKELKMFELMKLLEGFDCAEVGFGAGISVKASIAKAAFECPFISSGLKGLKGVVVCNLASVTLMSKSDLHSFVSTFRQTTKCTCELVVSFIHEPDLKDNMILTTILVMRKHEMGQKKSFFSKLASHFPFVFSFFAGKNPGMSSDSIVDTELPEISGLNQDVAIGNHVNGKILEEEKEELQDLLSDNFAGPGSLRNEYQEDQRGGFELPQSDDETFYMENQNSAGPFFQRETLSSWNFGPGFCISSSGSTATKMDTYPLPVGVKSLNLVDDSHLSNLSQSLEIEIRDNPEEETTAAAKVRPLDGLVAVAEIYNAAATLVKRKSSDQPIKQGLLSSRAASMLESERGSHNKWRPVMEMQYRGGIYKGRCQGGLPEGKGRLSLTDGSFYDGLWRYGMRSGLGTFCYPNGDAYQGSWRNDLIHGKGWFYFHTGDRWFANFWKGKASGEGRFYSKSGDVFFGHFQDGWRHGQCLYIDTDGTRWNEIWNRGVLTSRNKVDSEADWIQINEN